MLIGPQRWQKAHITIKGMKLNFFFPVYSINLLICEFESCLMKGEKWWQSLHYNIATMPWFDSSISTTSSHFVNLEFQSSIRLFDLKNKQTNWYDLSIHLKLFLQCYFMNTCGVKRVTSPSSLLCSFQSVSWYNVDEWHDWQVAVEYLKCNSELCEHHKCNFIDFYYLSVATEV